jgi:hypothetical protein
VHAVGVEALSRPKGFDRESPVQVFSHPDDKPTRVVLARGGGRKKLAVFLI